MTFTDILPTLALGVGLTSFGIAALLFLLAWLNRRANVRAERDPRIVPLTSKFLDWLTQFVLGPKRLDHEPMYSTLVAAFFLVGAFWTVVGPLPSSVIFPYPAATQVTLATCLFLGSGTCLYGISMGTPFDLWRHLMAIKRELANQDPLPPLDLRQAYSIGASGLPAVVAGLSYYDVVLIRATPLGWTAPSAIFLSFAVLGMSFQWLRFLMETRRINMALPMLIEQEVKRRLLETETIANGSTREDDQ